MAYYESRGERIAAEQLRLDIVGLEQQIDLQKRGAKLPVGGKK
jgi:hypothetical protein